jgi:hypothetical protein
MLIHLAAGANLESMMDDKTHRGEPDRSRVSGSEAYEVDHFAKQHGLTRQQAQDLIKKHGNNRKELDAAARRLKTAGK